MLTLFLKGIPIGISNVLPGISGGTIAVVLHIYDQLINAIKNINLKVLIPLGFGALLGLISTASLVNYLLGAFPGFMGALIFGLIIASVKVTLADIKKFNFLVVFFIIISCLLAYFLSRQAINYTLVNPMVSTGKIIFSGVVASVSMLLPGISGATVLVMLGMYEYIIDALLAINIKVILIFGISAIAGIIALSWILSTLLKKYRSELMAVLTGLIIGAALAVIPSSFTLVNIVGILLGISLIILLSRVSVN